MEAYLITFLLGIVVGAATKILIPWPWAENHVREGWRWLAKKIP